jgi:hypothetical protein
LIGQVVRLPEDQLTVFEQYFRAEAYRIREVENAVVASSKQNHHDLRKLNRLLKKKFEYIESQLDSKAAKDGFIEIEAEIPVVGLYETQALPFRQVTLPCAVSEDCSVSESESWECVPVE